MGQSIQRNHEGVVLRLPASQRAAVAMQELQVIRTELQRFTPDQVVWNHEDLSARPPWGDDIASRITDLSNYFVTSRGDDLIDLLTRTFAYSEANNIPVEIQ